MSEQRYVAVEVAYNRWWIVDREENPNEAMCECGKSDIAKEVAAALNKEHSETRQECLT